MSDIPSPEIEKRSVESILDEAATIDPSLVAKEILEWLINNVENYVDNTTKLYKIDLVVNSSEMSETKRLQNLYGAIPDDDLKGTLLSIKEEECRKSAENERVMDVCEKCRRQLDKITEAVFEEINENKDKINELFTRMIFFYEKIILNPESKKRAIEIDSELKSLIDGQENASDKEKKKIQDQIIKLIQEGESIVKFEQFDGYVSVTKFEYEAFTVGVKLQSKSTDEGNDEGNNEDAQVMKEYTIPEGFVVWLEIGYKHKQRPTGMF